MKAINAKEMNDISGGGSTITETVLFPILNIAAPVLGLFVGIGLVHLVMSPVKHKN